MSRKKDIKDIFEKLCRRIFQFLEDDLGFEIVASEQDSFGTYITYQNSTTAVRVSFEPREGGIFILLSRLINSKIPDYSIFVEAKTSLNSFYLDDIISLRSPSLRVEQQIEKLLNHNEMERILVQYANALKHYAIDILKGDFTIFDKLSEVVKKRSDDLKKRQYF